jgi:hypothetical protein
MASRMSMCPSARSHPEKGRRSHGLGGRERENRGDRMTVSPFFYKFHHQFERKWLLRGKTMYKRFNYTGEYTENQEENYGGSERRMRRIFFSIKGFS